MLGLPFLYLFQLGNAFLISTLNSRWLIIGFIMQAGFNIFFDYVLIFGNWGFPEMGFNGAALASVLAECIGMLSVLAVITFTGLKSKYQLFQTLNFNWEVTRKIIVVAFPLVLQYIISLATWFVFFLLIEEKGDLAKAVSNTMRNVFGMAGVFIWAFSGTSNAMVSNIIGQRKLYKVKPAIQRISLWSFGFCTIMVLLLNLFPNAFFALFGQSDSFNALSKDVLFVVSAGMLVMSVSNIWLNGLTGTGKTKVNLIIEITAISFYLIHTYFFMKLQYVSLAIAWSNELVYWGTILLFSYLYMRSQNWKKGAQSR
jgi:Na+-driven multidrug efflux pump